MKENGREMELQKEMRDEKRDERVCLCMCI